VDEIILEEMVTRERELIDKLSYLETRMSEASDIREVDSLADLWFDTETELILVQRALDNDIRS
jgi:hypothetical protein